MNSIISIVLIFALIPAVALPAVTTQTDVPYSVEVTLPPEPTQDPEPTLEAESTPEPEVPLSPDILTLDLSNATMEDLQTARGQIDQRIAEIKAAQAPIAGDVVTFEGSGASIIPIESFPFYPNRMTLTLEEEETVEITITGGTYDWTRSFTSQENAKSFVVSYDSVSYGQENLSLMVQARGAWSLQVEPLTETGTPAIEGAGYAVGNLFTMDEPIVMTLNYDCQTEYGFDYLSIQLVTLGDYGHTPEYIYSEYISEENLKGSVDVIVKPYELGEACFYIVECAPDTSWSLEPKE